MNTPFNLIKSRGKQNHGTGKGATTIGRAILNSCAVDVNLDSQETFRLDGDSRGIQIRALHGNLWITQTDDLKDYLLTPGEDLTLSSPGLVVIQGIRTAGFRLIPTNC
jgi:hypothetical protein